MENHPNLLESNGDDNFPAYNHLKACRYGKMLYNIHDTYMGQALEHYGEYAQGQINIFDEIIQPNWTVLDIGANIGCHTVFFARKVGKNGKVYAFEPQRLTFQTLCANIAINHLTNTYCEQIALGAHDGSILVPQITPYKDNNFGALSLQDIDYYQGDNIPLKRLDEYIFTSPQFIKIDVEGMELSVIQGAGELIKKHSPILFVENDRPAHSKQLIEVLLALDYNLYWAITLYYNPQNFFNNPVNIYNKTCSFDMLCIHQSIRQNIPLQPIKDSNVSWVNIPTLPKKKEK